MTPIIIVMIKTNIGLATGSITLTAFKIFAIEAGSCSSITIPNQPPNKAPNINVEIPPQINTRNNLDFSFGIFNIHQYLVR